MDGAGKPFAAAVPLAMSVVAGVCGIIAGGAITTGPCHRDGLDSGCPASKQDLSSLCVRSGASRLYFRHLRGAAA